MKALKDQFIPYKGNEYSPHILQTTAVIVMTMMVLLTFAITNIQSLLWMSSEWMLGAVLPAVVVTETNEERAIESLQPLTRSAVLDEAAKLKAQHMAQNSYFAHNSPDGKSPWYWFAQVDYNFIHAGENLAVHFKDSSQVVNAWMDSPTHRANIMNGAYQEIGIGVAEGKFEGFNTVFVVQLFGTPVRAYVPSPADEQIAIKSAEDEGVVAMTEEAPAQVLGINTAAADLVPVGSEATMLPGDTFIATSSPVAGTLDSTTAAEEVSELATVATQPSKVLQIIYIVLGLFVVIALSLSIVIEIRKQQPLQILYGVALLVMMGSLWFVHVGLTGTIIIL